MSLPSLRERLATLKKKGSEQKELQTPGVSPVEGVQRTGHQGELQVLQSVSPVQAGEVKDHPSWLAQIRQSGNKPEDWLQYSNYVRDNVLFPDDNTRVEYLSNIYAKAMKKMSPDEYKKNLAYAQLLINFALFKRDEDPEEARSIMTMARINAKYFSIVHLAAAQIELQDGKREKAKKILDKAVDIDLFQKELLHTALKNLNQGAHVLVSQEDLLMYEELNRLHQPMKKSSPLNHLTENQIISISSHQNNTEDLLLPKKSWTGNISLGNSTLSELLRPKSSGRPADNTTREIATSDINISTCDLNRCRLRSDLTESHEKPAEKDSPNGHLLFKLPTTPSMPTLMTTPAGPHRPGEIRSTGFDSAISGCRARNQSGNMSDDNDAIPFVNDRKKDVKDVGWKKTMKSYHSTPDCTAASSTMSSESKKFHGLPRRVKRTSLPQISGQLAGRDDTDTFHLSPLPECDSANEDAVLKQRKKSTNSDSGVSTSTNPLDYAILESSDEHKPMVTCTESMHTRNTGVERTCAGNMCVESTHPENICVESTRPGNACVERTCAGNTCVDTTAGQSGRPQDMDVSASSLHGSNSLHQNINYKRSGWSKSGDNFSGSKGHLASATNTTSSQAHAIGQSSALVHERKLVLAQEAAQPSVVQPEPQHRTVTERPKPQQDVFQTPLHKSQRTEVPNPSLLAPTPGYQVPLKTPMGKQLEVLTIHDKYYSVLKTIGRGGSSKVFEVLDECSNLRAVKVVNMEDVDEETIASYRNEIDLLKRLQHSDRIIRMYDFEYQEENKKLYVVMEKGDTDLAALFKSRNKQSNITEGMRKFYWEEMLRAVQVLQDEGIVHSDLKPPNFLLVAGHLKLIDFGIAKAIETDHTSAIRDQQVGTLSYISPEAVKDLSEETQTDDRGHRKPKIKIGVKSDVWSLGCILYNMVYGRTPFQKYPGQIQKLQALLNPRVVIDFPDIPDKDLMDVLKRCLRWEPKERPSINELLDHPYIIGKQVEQQSSASSGIGVLSEETKKRLVQEMSASSPRTFSAMFDGFLHQLQKGEQIDVNSMLNRKSSSASPQLKGATSTPASRAQEDKENVRSVPRAPFQPLNL